MKYFVIFYLICKISSTPIRDDRVIFPDELKFIQVDNRIDDEGIDQINLLDNPNILKSENASKLLLNQEQKSFQNPENGKYFQGDIVLLDEQIEILNDSSGSAARTGLLNVFRQWPKNMYGKVVVPFTMSDDFHPDEKAVILTAMYDIEVHTCIKFQFRTNERDYIYIVSEDGCYSYIGRKIGPQVMSLRRDDCISHGHILHELIHALGFHHMHNHIDRNDFVTIYPYNIKPNMIDQFIVGNPAVFGNFGTPYDYYSIMHYEANAFSKNGQLTIVPNDYSYRNVIGQRIGMSLGDVSRINGMYQCI